MNVVQPDFLIDAIHWANDISYIPVPKGFVYLAAVIDWYNRRVPAWRLSISMDTEFCMDVVEEAIIRYGTPVSFNTDQGSQFTSAAFIGLLTDHGIRISMDGKGCWRDNVFIEQLRRSIKYQEGVPACLGEREPGPSRNRAMHRVPQHPQAAFEPASTHTRCGVPGIAATAFGRGSLTLQDALKKYQDLFR